MRVIATRRPGRWGLQRRERVGPVQTIVGRLAAVGLALLLSGIALSVAGHSPVNLLVKAVSSTLGTSYGREQGAILATPLVLTALSVALGLRMRLWNIGIEGQLYIGAWAAAAVGLHFSGPEPLALILMCLAGALAGGLWILLPALARVHANVNEIITTLLLNPVAVLIVNHFSIGPWRDREVGTLTSTRRIAFELPTVLGTTMPLGFVLALVAVLVVWLWLRNSTVGYEVAVVGGNKNAAEFAGMPVKSLMIGILVVSGAISGLAGAIELSGTAHRLSGSISNDYGFIGIIVAVLCGASFLFLPFVGYLMAVLLNSGIVLQSQGLSLNAVIVINGLILLFLAIAEVGSQYSFRKVRVAAAGLPAGEEQLDVANPTQARRKPPQRP